MAKKKSKSCGRYDRQAAKMRKLSEARAEREASRLRSLSVTEEIEQRRLAQKKYIEAEGCEQVGIKSVMDLPKTGMEMVFGSPSHSHSHG